MDNRQHQKTSRMDKFLAKTAAVLHLNRPYQQAIARALPRTYFQGIDENDTHKLNQVRRRRAKNRVARKSRRINRKVASR